MMITCPFVPLIQGRTCLQCADARCAKFLGLRVGFVFFLGRMNKLTASSTFTVTCSYPMFRAYFKLSFVMIIVAGDLSLCPLRFREGHLQCMSS